MVRIFSLSVLIWFFNLKIKAQGIVFFVSNLIYDAATNTHIREKKKKKEFRWTGTSG